MTDGLSCTFSVPMSWWPENLNEADRLARMREAALILAALNQMESSHEMESSGPDNRRFERLEAKLDLALHLLARALHPGAPPSAREVMLSPREITWSDPHPPSAGEPLVLELRPSEQLPLSLKLPAFGLEPLNGLARARIENPPEALDEALHQFVFRRHRQAIRARSAS